MITGIPAFITQARTVDPTNADAVLAVCLPEVQWLIDQNGNLLTVQKKVIPLYKQALRDAGLVRGRYFADFGELWLKYLNVDIVNATFMQQYTQQYNQNRTQRLQGNRYLIHNVQDVIAQGMRLLDSGSLHDTVVGLALLTGRRDSELGLTATFTPYPGDAIHVDFTGQLKGGSEKRDTVFRIPIFGDRGQVCAALARVRAYQPWHAYTPHQFDNSVGSDVRKRAKHIFTPLFPGCELALSTHALRKVYGSVAEYFCRHTGWASHTYIASIMGHAETDDTSVKSYEYFQVVG